MPTMKQLRQEAQLTVFQLAVESGVSVRTINRMENDPRTSITYTNAMKLLEALEKKLGRRIMLQDVQELRVR